MTPCHSRTASLLGAVLVCLGCGCAAWGQQDAAAPGASLVSTGHVTVDGQPAPYRIRHLPVSSFPDLPPAIAAALTQRGCLVPQTYEAHRPENVVHASLERPGSSDWAVLCSANGKVSLLVFFGASDAEPATLATARETDRLELRNGAAPLGFDWGIDAASPQAVHEAQSGLADRPPPPDHDALADTVIDRRTTYRFFTRGAWTILPRPE